MPYILFKKVDVSALLLAKYFLHAVRLLTLRNLDGPLLEVRLLLECFCI